MELFIENKKKIVLSVLFILSLSLVLFRFTDTPKVWVDEGVFTEVARNVALHGILGLQTEPGNFFPMNSFFLSTSYPVIFPVALMFKVFGLGIWQARLTMVLYMLALVLLFYLFSKKRYGFYPAILSAFLLISFAPFYGDGRPVQGEVPGLTLLALGLFLLLLLEEKGFESKKLAILSGLAFGFSASVKPLYLVVLSASLFITLIFWYRKIHNKKVLFTFLASFLLPVFVWFRIHFPANSLEEIINMFTYFGGNHESTAGIFSVILHNFSRFFTESTPVLFMVLFCVTIFSFLFRFFKKVNNGFSITEYIALSFIVLNWLAYMPGTGWYRYFFPAHALIYMIFPGALFLLINNIEKPIVKKVSSLLPIALIIFQFFFLMFLSGPSFSLKQSRNGDLTNALSKINQSEKVLFYNSPEAIIFLKGNNYSQYTFMGGFLEVGDKNSIKNPKEDYILMSVPEEDPNFSLKCYDRSSMSSYFFFKKILNCKQ